MSLRVRPCPELADHLLDFSVDGATVASLLFSGGRLMYPGRQGLEVAMGYEEPYTLEMESRCIEGLSVQMHAAIRLLAREATAHFRGHDPTLDLLWHTHVSFLDRKRTSLDRLVAALVCVNYLEGTSRVDDVFLREAAEVMVHGMHVLGLPPTVAGIEEICDGAYPAAVGLGLIEL